MEKYKDELFDVILQAGQSNAEGCGIGSVAEEYVPNEKILYMNRDLTISIAEEGIWEQNKVSEFSLNFASEYIRNGKLDGKRKILILRSAVGGTGFIDKRWGMTDDLYLKMMEMVKTALKLNPENRLVAFLWHQGETDTGGSNSVTHYGNLKRLVESVRNTYKYPHLPFIAGDFVNEWKTANFAACEPIINAIKNVCNDVGNAGFVETSDLTSNNQSAGNGDTIHFSREALYKLGVRYYDAWVKLMQKQ